MFHIIYAFINMHTIIINNIFNFIKIEDIYDLIDL
jgi:hypothetical protein